MAQDMSTDMTIPDITGEIIHVYVSKENIKKIYAYRRDTLFWETSEERGETVYSIVISRVTCLLLPKLVAPVKKQPSVSYYKSPVDVSVI